MPKLIHGKPVKPVRIFLYESQHAELQLILGGNLTVAFTVLAQGLLASLHKDREGTLARVYSKGIALENILPMEHDSEPLQ